MPDLNLQDTMPFGKYKSRTLEEVYKENAAYLVWLRQERKDSNGDDKFFSREVSALLDMTIRDSKPLSAKYKPWDVPIDQAVRTQPGQIAEVRSEPELLYGGAWGGF